MSVVEWDEIQDRASLFDKQYWNGGGKVGGYANDAAGGYRDFSCHEITFRHVMARRPESVLEVGAARGYIGKRIQDAEIPWIGLEISKHCYMTRAANWLYNHDLCKVPWPIPDLFEVYLAEQKVIPVPVDVKEKWDLCLSIATLEHVPEEFLPAVIGEMQRTCRRGLHGIDFGENDDGFDKTHCSIFSKAKWYELFQKHAPGWPVEVVDKEDLERGIHVDLWSINREPGVVKANLGSFTNMHHGWVNVDVHDLEGFAKQQGFEYLRHDVRNGLPWKTGEVDLIFASHMIEHLDYRDGLNLLRECRRVLRPEGAIRIIVPDARLLVGKYVAAVNQNNPDFNDLGRGLKLEDFDEVNDQAAECPTAMGKFWSLIAPGHAAAYDEETLLGAMREAGFKASNVGFRQAASDAGRKILRETLEQHVCLSLFAEGTSELVRN